ncbi:transcription repressor OFP1-like [Punica granatum]|uniref:Transcription repressor n=2 Tax=Punica granatum TaxID=22663 RepID=A0A218W2S0_PUNGR|nr:transcription repressor OFP1-like [Punica granatum]OWM67065.1 hypothetical protein CDL15_Pgr000517 [Punica granatum]PKI38012.1 hypothetical protein CRG98_041608 [Punica granatum]
MGNYRFKLSDMVSNSWFYKLKHMAKSSRNHDPKPKKTEQQQQEGRAQKSHQHSVPRKSYHFTRDLALNDSVSPSEPKLLDGRYFPIANTPRQSTKQRRTNARKSRKKKPPRHVSSSVSAGCSCRATLDSVWAKTEPISVVETEFSSSPSSYSHSHSDSESSSVEQPPQLPQSFDQMVSWSTSCSCGVNSGLKDIVFDVGKSSFDPEIELPPIVTKPMKFTDMVKNVRRLEEADRDRSVSVKVVKEQTITVKEHAPASLKPSPVRGFAVNSPGVRLRINSNSPRIVPRQKTQGSQRKSSVSASSSSSAGSGNRRRRSVSDSFAIVKSSADPKRDFRESMVEMIMENDIRASKDLEELLACYLSLNSDEYHDVIISVFKQIWFDLSAIRLQ